ncbi:MAG: ACT domain-containing protein [Oscillospiraceae bacterium]
MHGVDKITSVENVMLVSYLDADALFMTKTLNVLADAGVVVDMISQTAPSGKRFRFSFSAAFDFFETAMKALGNSSKENPPMISGGFTKVCLFGNDMVVSAGVAARALSCLNEKGIAVSMITTSDYDISLLVRQEDADVSIQQLRNAFSV